MSNYLKNAATAVTRPPQSQPENNRQVPNSAGGFSYPVDCWVKMDRFLILGSEGGSYYASEKKLTVDNMKAVEECIKEDGIRAVKRIVEISDQGRAPKNDPALMALAMAASSGEHEVRDFALSNLSKVARIGTHLFHFVDYVQQFRGWGRGLKKAVQNWYLDMPQDKLADQIIKYQQRDGFSHRDVLRLAHAGFGEGKTNNLIHWVVKGEAVGIIPKRLEGHIKLQAAKTGKEAASLITEYGLVRESVPTELLKTKEVWQALLENMPMTALIRNLGNLSKNGILTPMGDNEKFIVSQLKDQEQLQKARVHPIQILMAMKTYESGHGMRGSGEWTVSTKVVDALDEAFYASFKFVKPSGKSFYLANDISGSMWSGLVAGIPDFSPAVATAAMNMVTIKSEPEFYAAGFTASRSGGFGGAHGGGTSTMTPMNLSSKQRLDDVLKISEKLRERMGGTDCSLPMIDALEKKLNIDTFVIYTDNETWAGGIHPMKALEDYRQKMGRNAKLIVCGMVSNEFTIADPLDAGTMDVVGFDSNTPRIISEFAAE